MGNSSILMQGNYWINNASQSNGFSVPYFLVNATIKKIHYKAAAA